MSNEHPPPLHDLGGLNPREDALALFLGDTDEIEQRIRLNIKFLTSRKFDQMVGPSECFQTILSRLSKGSVNDLSAFRMHLRQTVHSGLALRDQINFDAKNSWDEAKGSPDPALTVNATPYMHFTLAAGKENKADQNDENLPFSSPITFRRFASKGRRGYGLDDPKLAASASGLIFNILFHPDHTFRDEVEINQLVACFENELDDMIERARKRR